MASTLQITEFIEQVIDHLYSTKPDWEIAFTNFVTEEYVKIKRTNNSANILVIVDFWVVRNATQLYTNQPQIVKIRGLPTHVCQTLYAHHNFLSFLANPHSISISNQELLDPTLLTRAEELGFLL